LRFGGAIVAIERAVLEQLAGLGLIGGDEHFPALVLGDALRGQLHGDGAGGRLGGGGGNGSSRVRGPRHGSGSRRDRDRERETDETVHRLTSLVGPRAADSWTHRDATSAPERK